jgi:ribose-phosphate pyrophosphokinase
MNTPAYILNLDPLFNPLKDSVYHFIDLDFKKLTFPGGESHFQITNEFVHIQWGVIITARVCNEVDMFMILLANDALRRMGFTDVSLVIPYFPGGRQDRVCNPGEPLTVKVFADMINACKFSRVHIYSPHSDVTPALIDNCSLMKLDDDFIFKIVNDVIKDFQGVNIVCPDAGAGKRTYGLVETLVEWVGDDIAINFIRCEKVRDVKTGMLSEFVVHSDELNGYPTIICDDIIAYGGTFLGLAKVLKTRNCGHLILFTSHADCEEGLRAMLDEFDEVYTSDSRKNWGEIIDDSSFHCLPIELNCL